GPVGAVGCAQRAVVCEQPALHGGGRHRLPTAFAHLRHEGGQVLAVPAVGGQLVTFLVVVPELDQHMVPGRDRVQGGLPAALGYERVSGGATDRPVRDLVGDELVEHAAPPDHTGTVQRSGRHGGVSGQVYRHQPFTLPISIPLAKCFCRKG